MTYHYQENISPLLKNRRNNEKALLILPNYETKFITIKQLKYAPIAATTYNKIPEDCYWNATELDGLLIVKIEDQYAESVCKWLSTYAD